MSEATLPDNLKSRIARLYVADREFTGDDGKTIKYQRLVLQVSIKGEPLDIEMKADKKDLTLLGFADVLEANQQF